MLKKLILKNWKSFRHAELDIDALTILNRTAQGEDLQAALAGDPQTSVIRGGIEWATLKPGTQFTLQVLVGSEEDERTDYLYSITTSTAHKVQLVSESLDRIKKRPKTNKNPYKAHLFKTDSVAFDSPSITARLYNEKRGTPKELHHSVSILSQLNRLKGLRKDISEETPWAAFTDQQDLWDPDGLKNLAKEWPTLAAQGVSLGNATIKSVAERYAKLGFHVEILTGDAGLKSLEPVLPSRPQKRQDRRRK